MTPPTRSDYLPNAILAPIGPFRDHNIGGRVMTRRYRVLLKAVRRDWGIEKAPGGVPEAFRLHYSASVSSSDFFSPWGFMVGSSRR